MDPWLYQRPIEQVGDRAGDGSPVMQGCQLAAAAGTVAATVVRGQHGLLTDGGYRDILRDGLADLLHHAIGLAGTVGLDIGDIAARSRAAIEDHDVPRAAGTACTRAALPAFDAGFPDAERFPRRLAVEFQETTDQRGQRTVIATLRSCEPSPSGRPTPGDRSHPQPGDRLGDPLTDNARRADGYRFHDAIHLGFLTVLGWSPTLRALLRRKRKSDPVVDECEDGARAIFTEEGLAAVLARLAETRVGFRHYDAVTRDIVDVARAVTTGLEVGRVPGWLWRHAIWQGFRAMDHLVTHGGGLLVADLDARELTFKPAGGPTTQPWPHPRSSSEAA